MAVLQERATDTEWKLYWYNPSIPAAVVFIVLFGALILCMTYHLTSSIIHIKKNKLTKKDFKNFEDGVELYDISKQLVHDVERSQPRSKYFGSYRYVLIMIPFYFGLWCEVIGYISRAKSHDNTLSRNLYIIQSLLLLIAPPFFSASIYMVFGRLVTNTLHNEGFLLIRARFITKLCVVGDVLSLLLQGSGGGILATSGTNPGNYELGQNTIIGGLVVQILFFGFFIVIEVVYFMKLQRHLFANEFNAHVVNETIREYPSRLRNWKAIGLTLFLCSIFILIRSVYRIVEFRDGNGGYMARNEWLLYIFDALMMFLCSFFFVVQNPADYFLKTIPKSMDGQSEYQSE